MGRICGAGAALQKGVAAGTGRLGRRAGPLPSVRGGGLRVCWLGVTREVTDCLSARSSTRRCRVASRPSRRVASRRVSSHRIAMLTPSPVLAVTGQVRCGADRDCEQDRDTGQGHPGRLLLGVADCVPCVTNLHLLWCCFRCRCCLCVVLRRPPMSRPVRSASGSRRST